MQQWKVEKGVGGQKEFRRGWIKKPELSQQHERERERESVGEEKASGQENAFFPFHFLFWENNIIPQAGKARV